MSPLVSSILSKHTGQVGSSIRFGVGGGNGFKVFEIAEDEPATALSSDVWLGVSKEIFLTNTA